ncbi:MULTISPECIES: amino acid ABC transporter permease [Comamonas]|jgi:polar amino acid transport system permease protein|uniref:Amino acid ABC transporter permease n=1 Tax=Comamonas squillarum TaxID=2977320 RepID=A0ABY5ZZC3_9BURK|nr:MULTISPECIES: amino acid ABC transporter permease [Comamonas]PWB18834.1 polar amino acid ABC transporter permease [Comamonas sp. JNW]UXC19362.1 amino acid ABC transporter permease [Comamonas sp. PR12]
MSESSGGFLFTFFNLAIAQEYWADIARGMLVTIGVGIAVVITGLALGLAMAIGRALQLRWLTAATVIFSDVMRSLPPLVVLILLYFGLPTLGLELSAFAATWVSLSMVLAAYAQESIWSAMASLAKGQTEAARSTGLSWWQAMRWVVLPQALRRAVPPLTNRVISTTKNTALGSIVALGEILSNAQAASAVAGNPTPLTIGAFLYLLVFLPIVIFSRWLEHKTKTTA